MFCLLFSCLTILEKVAMMTKVPCLSAGTAATFDLANFRGKFVLLLFQVSLLVILLRMIAVKAMTDILNLILFQPVDFGYIGPTELELLDSLHSECEVIILIVPKFLIAVSIYYQVVAVTSGSVVGK